MQKIDTNTYVKVLYFGAAGCGISTILHGISTGLPPDEALETTLFFDAIPIMGPIEASGSRGTIQVCIQVYGLGFPLFNTTDISAHARFFKDVDGFCFVVDSQKNQLQANKEALRLFQKHLITHNLADKKIPLVVQYNKCDLESAMDFEDLQKELNPQNLPAFKSVAFANDGFYDGFNALIDIIINPVIGPPIAEDE